MPRPFVDGQAVTIAYFAASEPGIVERVADGGRIVVVVTETDQVLEFHLMARVQYFTRDRSARLIAACGP